MQEGFKEALEAFIEGSKKIVVDHFTKNCPNLPVPAFGVDMGKRYIRITCDRSVHAFVDKTNGDVLKPASWKAPAKHARGNIFDAKSGLGSMGPFGPAYLR